MINDNNCWRCSMWWGNVVWHSVFIKPRKHLSSHPKAASWDQTAITELGRKLGASGEVFFYDKAMVGTSLLTAS